MIILVRRFNIYAPKGIYYAKLKPKPVSGIHFKDNYKCRIRERSIIKIF